MSIITRAARINGGWWGDRVMGWWGDRVATVHYVHWVHLVHWVH